MTEGPVLAGNCDIADACSHGRLHVDVFVRNVGDLYENIGTTPPKTG
jgi:hypothetical protein